MKLTRPQLRVFFLVLTLVPHAAFAEWDVGGEMGLELRVFPQKPAYSGQERSAVSPSIVLEPEFRHESESGNNRFTFRPFARWDTHDENRSHVDVREANFLHIGPTWDILAGVSRVFWGVTESVHLVDIINQTDAVEDIDSEDKLGQPMLNLNLLHNSGTYSMFVLPGFRERTFPTDDARRSGPFPVDTNNASFESGAENRHIDFAARWSHTVGDWDLGLSYFYGTSREPRLLPYVNRNGAIVLRPQYDLIQQLGLEVQYTTGAWLWKMEAIERSGHGSAFLAAVAGFEYSLFQVGGSSADLGLLAEIQYDGRDEDGDAPLTTSDNDLFVAARLALNDEASSSLLAGLVYDFRNATTLMNIEAERRINDHWKAVLEARLILHADEDDPIYSIRRDSSITLRMSYAF